MDKSYRFLSDVEPTDEQWEGLMLLVAQDVKERAEKAEAKYKALQAQSLKEALEWWEQKQKSNLPDLELKFKALRNRNT